LRLVGSTLPATPGVTTPFGVRPSQRRLSRLDVQRFQISRQI